MLQCQILSHPVARAALYELHRTAQLHLPVQHRWSALVAQACGQMLRKGVTVDTMLTGTQRQFV